MVNKKNKLNSILELSSNNFTHNIWGGRWIPTLKKSSLNKKGFIGESWEFSSKKSQPSIILWRGQKSQSLPGLIKKNARQIFGRSSSFVKNEAPFLLKFIDANRQLSIQVHPDNRYASRVEKQTGKAESWIILGARKSGHVYLGLSPRVKMFHNSKTAKQKFETALNKAIAMGPSEKESDQLKAARHFLPFLNKIQVKPGDVFHVEPGTLHAIGKGVQLFEIQQSSDITYRVWDWNRPSLRELHLKKAFDVIQFRPYPVKKYVQRPLLVSESKKGGAKVLQILKQPQNLFATDQIILNGEKAQQDLMVSNNFFVLTVLKGNVVLYQQQDQTDSLQKWGRLKQGHSALVPASLYCIRIESEKRGAEIFKSYVPLN